MNRYGAALHVGTTVHSVLQQWNLARWRRTALDISALKAVFEQAWISQEGIDWEESEEPARQSEWAVLETYFRDTPIPADEKPEGVEVTVGALVSRAARVPGFACGLYLVRI